MRQSPEIRELVMRTLEYDATKNVAAIMELCTREPGLLFVGTDPGEWITSREELEKLVRVALENSSGRMPNDLVLDAFEEGTVGWAVYHYSARLPNGSIFMIRWTNIYHQESGGWKYVHGHVSVGIPDALVPSIAQAAS